MISATHKKLLDSIDHLFPGQVEVYPVDAGHSDIRRHSELLHRHFREPLGMARKAGATIRQTRDSSEQTGKHPRGTRESPERHAREPRDNPETIPREAREKVLR